ncbi:MAG: hypothetical protein IPK76_14435 [Lewinellaceae bacterium]|nr:hypothetical protein [Lewinellaceae bacterium]
MAARTNLDVTKAWTFTGDAASGTNCVATDAFITTWKTDNPGASNSTSITIPTTGSGYNYEVDWDNDGVYDQSGITGNVTHDFGTAGTYTIRIRGVSAHLLQQWRRPPKNCSTSANGAPLPGLRWKMHFSAAPT